MKQISKITELKKEIKTLKEEGYTIGFVPTMGALHEGHMQLIRESNTENDITVCSVFVNPTQFNEKTDLDKYPRNLKADARLLKKNKAHILFAPTVRGIYPKGDGVTVEVDLEGLDERMEGAFRPGHFKGVVQVVHRLVDIVRPTRLYMGQKDFQQFTIIHKMLQNLDMDTQLRVVPIVRADDGLALSSRNKRLTKHHRSIGPKIYKVLKSLKRKKYEMTVKQLEKYGMQRLQKVEGFKPEYVSIVDGYNLTPVKNMRKAEYVVVCTAVWAGEVRLIDNLIIKKPRKLDIFTN